MATANRRPRIRAFLANHAGDFVAGLLLATGLPPFGWWPLALIGTSLTGLALRSTSWPDRFRRAGTVGAGFLGPGLFWMSEFHVVGFLLAVALQTFFFATVLSLGSFAPSPRGSEKTRGSERDGSRPEWMLLTLPASLVIADAFRSAWPFGGTPIALISQTQIGGPLAQVARLGGGLGVTATVGLLAGSLALLALLVFPASRRAGVGPARANSPATEAPTTGVPRVRARGVVVLGFAVVLGVTIGATLAPHGRDVGAITVSLVQGGGQRGTRAITSDATEVVRAHVRANAKVPKGVDLILWPEDVLENDGAIEGSDTDRGMGALARQFNAPIAAGVFEVHDGFNRNAAVAWDRNGDLGPRYEKNQRVPFGEYVPFRSLVESLVDVSAIPKDALVGRGPAILRTSAANLGVVISYEVFFSRRTRAAMDEGAELLYVPTNANSFTTTQMPALELGATRLRAIETGRYVLQVAPTGFSAIVDPEGNVVSHSDLGAQAVLTNRVQRRTGSTLYTRTGDAPIVVSALLIVATTALNRRRNSPLGSDARRALPSRA